MLAIESNIPPSLGRPTGEIVSTLRSLEIGQSVFLEGKTARQAGRYAQAAKGGAGKYFQCRTLTTGARIWRLE
jgi:hypothetical protein